MHRNERFVSPDSPGAAAGTAGWSAHNLTFGERKVRKKEKTRGQVLSNILLNHSFLTSSRSQRVQMVGQLKSWKSLVSL